MSARSARIAALILPSLIVLLVVSNVRGGIVGSASMVLLELGITAMGALVALALDARSKGKSGWDRIDVLSSTGAAMMWTGAGALVISTLVGWASLSVVGVLGVGTVYLVVIWTSVVAGGDLFRRATITRSIVPERSIEGEALREEIVLRDVRIPAGMRLFVTGRAMRHGATSRYAVDSSGSGAELKLGSELGPAQRGEHRAEPLELWLADVLGITRTPIARRAEASFTVLPRTIPVDGAQALLGAGGESANAMPTQTIPTEGSFRIREYVDGDDTRRIHWMRSLQQNRLIVRLPDEVPPADPAVRLILDNELSGIDGLSCAAPAAMLDTLVRIWLGIGKALADSGTRVTLVAAVQNGHAIEAVERLLMMRSPRDSAMQLGARVCWQSTVPLDAVLDRRGGRQIVVSARPRRIRREVSWVVVPEGSWTMLDFNVPRERAVTHHFPAGSVENRPSRRALEQVRVQEAWHDRAVFSELMTWRDWSRFSGDHVARPNAGRAILEVIA